MIRFSKILFFGLGAGLSACSFFSPRYTNSEAIRVETTIANSPKIDSIIVPYTNELATEMNTFIGFSPESISKGRPCSSLNNWVADAILHQQISRKAKSALVMVLLNVGGIRSTLNKGNITVGDIFTLMPFDNTIVWVWMPGTAIPMIEEYIRQSGGEPIAGVELIDGKIVFEGNVTPEYFWIITSDYLYNGGDKMSFFELGKNVDYTNRLLRDDLIEEVKTQGTLRINKECRIRDGE